MLIRCPECRFERQIDENAIPANAAMATCPHCQYRFRFRTPDGTPVVDETPAAAPAPQTAPEKRSDFWNNFQKKRDGESKGKGGIAAAMHVDGTDVPWEEPKRYNLFMALYQTILRVMFNAPRFFAALPATNGKLTRPLVFYLILGMFQTLVERMWYLMSIQASGPSITDPKLQEVLGDVAQSMSLPLTILLTPGILAIQLCFFASVFYLMLRLGVPGHRLQRRAHRGLRRPAGRPARRQHLVRRLLLHRMQVLHAPAVVPHRAGPRPALPHRVRHRYAAYPAVPEHERLKNTVLGKEGKTFPEKREAHTHFPLPSPSLPARSPSLPYLKGFCVFRIPVRSAPQSGLFGER